jgi:transposase
MGRRSQFTSEFKAQAVRRVTDQGLSVAEAAEQLGISGSLLRKWKRASEAGPDQAFPGPGRRPLLEDQLHRLRAENQRLRRERDILKKALGYFAGGSP